MSAPTVEQVAAAVVSSPSAMAYWICFGRDDLTFEEWAERKAAKWLGSHSYIRSIDEDYIAREAIGRALEMANG